MLVVVQTHNDRLLELLQKHDAASVSLDVRWDATPGSTTPGHYTLIATRVIESSRPEGSRPSIVAFRKTLLEQSRVMHQHQVTVADGAARAPQQHTYVSACY